jgi:E3 ubiquitin-protein ligase NEDD4
MQSLRQEDWRRCFVFSFKGEPGLDAGGVTREWFEELSKALFLGEGGVKGGGGRSGGGGPEAPLFCSTVAGGGGGASLMLAPPHESRAAECRALQRLVCCGQLLGKAIFDRRTIHAPLMLPLFKHVLAVPVSLRDLEAVDADVYRSLLQLLAMDAAELAAMSLDFTITRETTTPAPPPAAAANDATATATATAAQRVRHSASFTTVELLPGGGAIDVDATNVEQYVQLRLQDRMLTSVSERLAALLLGVYHVVPQHLLSIFDYSELELLVGGVPVISTAEWRRHARYGGEYAAAHRVVGWFWAAVEELEPHEQAKLLQFVTGSSRVPAHGFEALQGNDGRVSPFTVVSVPLERELPWPKASTCFNRLYLPLYESEKQLQHNLRITVRCDVTGFGFE